MLQIVYRGPQIVLVVIKLFRIYIPNDFKTAILIVCYVASSKSYPKY